MNKSSVNKSGVVLLHGAGLGSYIWDQVIPLLKIPALAIDLPGRASIPSPTEALSLEQCSDYVLDKIQNFPANKVILVAHSVSGGLALKVASALKEKIATLVFVAAAVPENGKAYVDELPWLSRTLLRLLYRFKPQGMLPPENVIRKVLCHDLKEAQTQTVLAHLVIEHPSLFLDQVLWENLSPDIQRIYVTLLDDKSDLNLQLQKKMSARLKSTRVFQIQSGHLPMLSQPERVAEILNEIVG